MSKTSENKEIDHTQISKTLEKNNQNQYSNEFLVNLNHELKTPLNSILGYSEFLLNDPEEILSDRHTKFATQILSAGQHLKSLIENVNELMTLETKAKSLDYDQVDLLELIQSCIDLIQPFAFEHSIKTTLNSPTEHPVFLWANSLNVKQIILNLLSNAIKYNHAGGSVEIGYENMAANYVRIFVSDTGPGIPEEERENVFIPFNRLGMENSEKEGTGIGLAISLKMVKLMNGKMGFDSKINKGSKFWLELPQAQASTTSSHSNKRSSKNSKTLLFVAQSSQYHSLFDQLIDHLRSTRMLDDLVKKLPLCNIFTAHNSSIGEVMAEELAPDLIILAVSGLSNAQNSPLSSMSSLPTKKQIPILAMVQDFPGNNNIQNMDLKFDAIIHESEGIEKMVSAIKVFV